MTKMNNSDHYHRCAARDENRVPGDITWHATDAVGDKPRKSKAMMMAFWDGEEKTAMRIDLWTKAMMIDEMTDFSIKQ